MKTLYLLRHAKSDWNAPGLTDFERPINQRGEKAAAKMGNWMDSNNICPDKIISSTALRARQTIEIVCSGMQYDASNIDWADSMYLANLTTLLNTASDYLLRFQSVMLVGHNPGMDEMVMYLNDGDAPSSDSGKLMATATMAHFEIAEELITNIEKMKHACSLIGVHWPKQL